MGGGASYFFGPNYLIENDVVLVTFNYRYLLKKLKLEFFLPPLCSQIFYRTITYLPNRNIYVVDKHMHIAIIRIFDMPSAIGTSEKQD